MKKSHTARCAIVMTKETATDSKDGHIADIPVGNTNSCRLRQPELTAMIDVALGINNVNTQLFRDLKTGAAHDKTSARQN